MNNKYKSDDLLDKQYNYYLTEKDFYPPYDYYDNRVWKSYVEDIDGGDNFADYCRDFFELLDEEEYFES